ncbi:ankyrin repeat and BTB/POZ domain-containing protein 1-like [Saccoglossus kowalevskii]|uniref:Ankyrin repeat and BTB/POZ domain-containing protein 1-like n=1 Tax=Saccoglossus kowalevskii TaxID=10224 RepID=A0ABM0GYK8_SACKO|nr:PREDICTED: ankyrin repeat and BTB/POZ domain-containing protein 1-like [Saccoglossus kowalevskii]
MEVSKLFLSCKLGDLDSVKYLVETKEVELNVRDKWDSTPLYYACFCGHEELVDYLLQCGAKCEPNTFDGERCLYGALSDSIRNVLKNYKAITAHCMRRDSYQEFLRRLLDEGSYEDICFAVRNSKFTAHRCILSVRSEYFAEMLKTRWRNKMSVNLKHPLVSPYAFKAILRYIYTDRLEIHMEDIDDVIRLAKQCQLVGLISRIDDAVKKTDSFVCAKPGTRVTVISIDENCYQLHEDLGVLAEQAIPNQIKNWVSHGELPFFTEEENIPYLGDICFSVQGYNFYCHKVFFCCRSDYFKALLSDHFSEVGTDSLQGIPVVYLQDVNPDVFSQVVRYLYTDKPQISAALAYDVLCVADRYLLPGLKRLSANVISQNLDEFNVISVVKAARLFELHRLEDQCAEYMAAILDKIIYTEEFAELIQEDASSVQERQETDSIPIIDDIRYHITSTILTYSDMAEANEKLAALDDLLIRLGVEC